MNGGTIGDSIRLFIPVHGRRLALLRRTAFRSRDDGRVVNKGHGKIGDLKLVAVAQPMLLNQDVSHERAIQAGVNQHIRLSVVPDGGVLAADGLVLI